MSFLFRASLVLIFLTACTRNSGMLTSDEASRIRQETKAMLQQYNVAVRSKGLLGEFDYLDSSSRFSWFPPGFNLWISYDSVSVILKANAARFRSISNTWDTLRIEPLTPELAAYSGILLSESEDTSGKVTKIRLKETGTLIRRNNKWKLLTGQTAVLDANP
jgi:hypothetical protein